MHYKSKHPCGATAGYYYVKTVADFSFKNVLFKCFFEKNSKKYCHFIVTRKKKKPTNPLFIGLVGI